MRVVSGKARGLKLNTIDSDSTRPTKDMVKEALFSMLSQYIDECTFLDLFAGSGAIGIEALSRGANKSYFVDNNKACIDIINENINKAKLNDNSIVIHKDYIEALNLLRDILFDVIYVDPPYNQGLGIKAIEIISSYDLLVKNGVLVFETDTFENAPDVIGKYEKYKVKKYGRNILNFYKERSNK